MISILQKPMYSILKYRIPVGKREIGWDISGPRNGVAEDSGLPGCYAV